MRNKPCVYFLIRDGVIVYIGQTKNVATRILEHWNKNYNAFRMIPCHVDKLRHYEGRLINYFKPEYNKTINRPPVKITQTFRLDSKYVGLAKKWAKLENRTLSNFYEHAVFESLKPKRND